MILIVISKVFRGPLKRRNRKTRRMCVQLKDRRACGYTGIYLFEISGKSKLHFSAITANAITGKFTGPERLTKRCPKCGGILSRENTVPMG